MESCYIADTSPPPTLENSTIHGTLFIAHVLCSSAVAPVLRSTSTSTSASLRSSPLFVAPILHCRSASILPLFSKVIFLNKF
ncbi:hypothetical protein HN51_070395, partial [Arachis hypogaea]